LKFGTLSLHHQKYIKYDDNQRVAMVTTFFNISIPNYCYL